MAIALLWGFVIACLVDPTEIILVERQLEDVDLPQHRLVVHRCLRTCPLSSLEPPFFSDANRHVTDRGFLENVGVKFPKKARN